MTSMPRTESTDGPPHCAWQVVSVREMSLLSRMDSDAGTVARRGPVHAEPLGPGHLSERLLPTLQSTAQLPSPGLDPTSSPIHGVRPSRLSE